MKIICYLVVTISALILLKINSKKKLIPPFLYWGWVLIILIALACLYWRVLTK